MRIAAGDLVLLLSLPPGLHFSAPHRQQAAMDLDCFHIYHMQPNLTLISRKTQGTVNKAFVNLIREQLWEKVILYLCLYIFNFYLFKLYVSVYTMLRIKYKMTLISSTVAV